MRGALLLAFAIALAGCSSAGQTSQVDWPEIALNEGPVSTAELQAHPLANGILSPAQLQEIFAGQWTTTWANTVDRDSIPVPNGLVCNAGTTVSDIRSEGIDLSYRSIEGLSIELNLRRGDEADLFIEAARHSFGCEFGPDAFPQRSIATGADEQVVYTSREELSGTESYTSFVTVRSGDLIVSASIDAETGIGAEANEQLLVDAVSKVLAQLGA